MKKIGKIKNTKKDFTKEKSIRRKLVAAIVAMSVLPMIVLGIILYANNVSTGLSTFKAQVASEITKVDDGLSSYFDAIFGQVTSLAQVQEMQAIDTRISEYITKEPDTAEGRISMRPESSNPYERDLYYTLKRVKEKNPQIFSICVGVEEHGGFLMYTMVRGVELLLVYSDKFTPKLLQSACKYSSMSFALFIV